MKKLLIVNNNMHIGGVQKALVSLLWSIRDQYEVTLLLFHKGGECMKEIPPEIKVITPGSSYRYLGMTKYDACGLTSRMARGFFGAVTRVLGRKYAIGLMALGQKKLEGYDVAVSYLHNSGAKVFYGGCNEFVLKHVSAGKKVAFLHCDYQLCGANTAENGKQYAEFDAIAACSQGCADSFLAANPALKEKVEVVTNCHCFEKIRMNADSAPANLPEGAVNIVTVARLGKEKGVERALRAIARLGPLKEKLRYHIIGDGIQKPLLQQIIAQEELESIVTMWGMLENPYGNIKAADLLLIPSYSEAAPLVIGEAASLGTPILSTETSSAKEMLEKTGFGWVCDNSESAMTQILAKLLLHPSMLEEAKNTLLEKKFHNEKAVFQFHQIADPGV